MRGIRDFAIESWQQHRPLVVIVLFSCACLILSASGLALDHKLIAGENAWIKPCKFSVSLATYGVTLLWYSRFLTQHQVLFRRMTVAAMVGTMVELSTIIVQVLRGTTSHFNTSTTLNHVLFWITTSAIVPVALALVALFIMLLREKNLHPVLGTALRWALLITIVGFVPGVLMILPDQFQDAITTYKQFDGHTVGFPEGGPGIPFLGWSTVAGDLRIAHFVGIHALQVVPLLGLLIDVFMPKLRSSRQQLLVWMFSIDYLAVIVLLTWQALSAESLFAPGHITIWISWALCVLTSAVAACIVWLPPLTPWKSNSSHDMAESTQ
jgi:hypothetical protein